MPQRPKFQLVKCGFHTRELQHFRLHRYVCHTERQASLLTHVRCPWVCQLDENALCYDEDFQLGWSAQCSLSPTFPQAMLPPGESPANCFFKAFHSQGPNSASTSPDYYPHASIPPPPSPAPPGVFPSMTDHLRCRVQFHFVIACQKWNLSFLTWHMITEHYLRCHKYSEERGKIQGGNVFLYELDRGRRRLCKHLT